MRLRSAMWMLWGLAALPLYAASPVAAPRVALSQPSVSADGRAIAFVADGGIWTVSSSGGKAHLLVADDGGMGDWQWWRHGRSHLDEGAIWLLRDDGSHQYTRLTADDARAEWPMWAANGHTLYYMSDRSGAENIWRVVPGGGESALTRFSDGRVLWPGLSADGRLLRSARTARPCC